MAEIKLAISQIKSRLDPEKLPLEHPNRPSIYPMANLA